MAKCVWRFAASDENAANGSLTKHLPASWPLGFDGVRFEAMPTPFVIWVFSGTIPALAMDGEQIGQFKTAYNRPRAC